MSQTRTGESNFVGFTYRNRSHPKDDACKGCHCGGLSFHRQRLLPSLKNEIPPHLSLLLECEIVGMVTEPTDCFVFRSPNPKDALKTHSPPICRSPPKLFNPNQIADFPIRQLIGWDRNLCESAVHKQKQAVAVFGQNWSRSNDAVERGMKVRRNRRQTVAGKSQTERESANCCPQEAMRSGNNCLEKRQSSQQESGEANNLHFRQPCFHQRPCHKCTTDDSQWSFDEPVHLQATLACSLRSGRWQGKTTARRSEGRRRSTHEGEAAAFASSFFAVIASFRNNSSHWASISA